MGRMGSTPILPVRQAITISTMIKLDGDGDGNGNGVGTCKHSFRNYRSMWSIILLFRQTTWLSVW